MTDLLALARECGASRNQASSYASMTEFTDDQLAAYTARVLEEAAKECGALAREYERLQIADAAHYADVCAARIQALAQPAKQEKT